jgi:putative transposase
MKIITTVLSGTSRLGRIAELSREAGKRLKWFDYYNSHGGNARLTCRHFDISPQTFYRWKRRYDPRHLESLEGHSCRPLKVRRPTYLPALVEAVLSLRERYPRWGKDKLVVLLGEESYSTSASTVGRIIHHLKERGVLKEAVRNPVSAHRRGLKRPYGIRKPKDYEVKEPGDLVEMDTLDIRPLPGVVLKHFTAHDLLSRWNVLSIHSRATAVTASHFLDTL